MRRGETAMLVGVCVEVLGAELYHICVEVVFASIVG